jgi:4-carboxymuconolactone decarboxylase
VNDELTPDARTREARARVLPSSPASSAAPGSSLERLEQIAFGEVWSQPGLSSRERRLITLACLGIVGSERTVGLHIRGALDSGDLTPEELDAFILHFGVYAGFPRASAFGSALARAVEERSG